VKIITAALHSTQFDLRKFSIVPFPIQAPELVRNFVDDCSIMFTTIYDEWNEKKISRLKEQGFSVCVLWKREFKQYEGKIVRSAMRGDWQKFEALVPPGVAEVVRSILNSRKDGAD
jgi:nicotinamide-nucleotide adenylyltransferase